MVAINSEDTIAESLRIAAELRKTYLRVLVYPEPDKLGKQFKYADSIKVRYVCIPGEGSIKLKDLTTGEQSDLSVKDISKAIRSE
jgi:histidyl-tRNA synthetase